MMAEMAAMEKVIMDITLEALEIQEALMMEMFIVMDMQMGQED